MTRKLTLHHTNARERDDTVSARGLHAHVPKEGSIFSALALLLLYSCRFHLIFSSRPQSRTLPCGVLAFGMNTKIDFLNFFLFVSHKHGSMGKASGLFDGCILIVLAFSRVSEGG